MGDSFTRNRFFKNLPAFVKARAGSFSFYPIGPVRDHTLSRYPALVLNIMVVGVSFEEFKARIPALVAQLKPFHFAHRDLALRTAPEAVREQFNGDEDLIFGHYIAYGWPVEKAETVETVPVKKPRRKVSEPGTGIEPATRSLQNCRSTTELSRPSHSLSIGEVIQGQLEEIAAAAAQKFAPRAYTKPWPALMTLKVAQEYTGIGESKLKQLIFAKELPNSSPDTTIRIMRKDLDALMERCRR